MDEKEDILLYYSTVVPNSRLKKLLILFFIALGLFGVVNMFSAELFSGLQKIQADQVDTLFNAYILEHGYRSFFDPNYKWHFYNPPFYYPNEDLLFDSDNLLGTAPIYWFFRIFFDWATSFQLWGIIQGGLTYIFTLILFLSLNINPVISGLCSYVFSFGMPRISQLSHPQLFAQFYTSISLFFLFRFLKTPRIKEFNLFMAFLTLQLVGGYYMGWFYILSLFVAFFIYGLINRQNFIRIVKEVTNGFTYLKWTLFWGLVNGLYWYKYIIRGGSYKLFSVYEHGLDFLNSPISFFTPVRGSLWFQITGGANGITQENYIFPGIFMYVLVCLSVLVVLSRVLIFPPKKIRSFVIRFREVFLFDLPRDMFSIIATGLITGGILMFLSVVFFDITPWGLVYILVPGNEGIRYGARIWIVAYLWLLISGGLTATHLLTRLKLTKNMKILLTVLALFVVIEQVVIKPAYTSKNDFMRTVTRLSEAIRKGGDCDFSYFKSKEMPLFSDGTSKDSLRGSKHIEAMFTSFYTGIPSLNGYTAWTRYSFNKYYTAVDLAKITGKHGVSACIYDEDGFIEKVTLP